MAREIFTGLVARVNCVGLLPGAFDPGTGEYPGNFPYTHIGLINRALYLAHAEGRWVPEHAPAGGLRRSGGVGGTMNHPGHQTG